MSNPELDRLSASRNILLTTSRGDGRSTTTAEWFARESDHLYLVVDGSSGTADDIRANSGVELAPCDRGGRAQGSPTAGRAELVVDRNRIRRTSHLLRRRYGLAWPLLGILMAATGQRPDRHVAVRITIPD